MCILLIFTDLTKSSNVDVLLTFAQTTHESVILLLITTAVAQV